MAAKNKKKCRIQKNKTQTWELNPETLNSVCKKTKKSIYDAMYEDVEYAATFLLRHGIGKTCTTPTQCKYVPRANLELEYLNKGTSSSVKTDDGLCNFHTHPIKCYLDEVTAWGWPSGEDMREAIGFMLRGNLVHFVFALEGIYVIRVNPSVAEAFYHLENDDQRGIVLSLIESYFVSTHGFRNVQFYDHPRAREFITPHDWVQFANAFRFEHIVGGGKDNSSASKCPRTMPCDAKQGRILNYSLQDNDGEDFTLQEFIETFPPRSYRLSRMKSKLTKGNVDVTKYLSNQRNVEKLRDHFRHYTQLKNQNQKEEGFEANQWFRCDLYENEIRFHPQEPFEFLSNHLKKQQRGKASDIAIIWHDLWKQAYDNPDVQLFRFHPRVIRFKGHAFEGESCSIK